MACWRVSSRPKQIPAMALASRHPWAKETCLGHPNSQRGIDQRGLQQQTFAVFLVTLGHAESNLHKLVIKKGHAQLQTTGLSTHQNREEHGLGKANSSAQLVWPCRVMRCGGDSGHWSGAPHAAFRSGH